jgi:hypothetical protein
MQRGDIIYLACMVSAVWTVAILTMMLAGAR